MQWQRYALLECWALKKTNHRFFSYSLTPFGAVFLKKGKNLAHTPDSHSPCPHSLAHVVFSKKLSPYALPSPSCGMA